MPRTCLYCERPIKGRADKKYCGADCRNKFHYQRSYPSQEIVKVVNQTLVKNRSILEALFKDEKRKHFKIEKHILTKLGFNFEYYTGTYINKAGKQYHYVYDYAWMPFSMQEVMIVQKK